MGGLGPSEPGKVDEDEKRTGSSPVLAGFRSVLQSLQRLFARAQDNFVGFCGACTKRNLIQERNRQKSQERKAAYALA